MGLIEQKELTEEAALGIVYSSAVETFEKMAEAVECEYTPEEVKEAIMKQAGTGGDVLSLILGGPYVYAGKKIKEKTGDTGKSILYPGLVGAGLGGIAGGIKGGITHGPKGALLSGLGGLLGGGIGGAATGGIGSLLKQDD